MHGLVQGFRAHDVDAQVFHVEEWHWLAVELLRDFAPELVLLPSHNAAWQLLGPYLEALEPLDPTLVGLTYDDPYDLKTGLEIARRVDFVASPEPLAVELYRRELQTPAMHLPPFVSSSLHWPAPAEKQTDYAVFFVGGNQWRPRKEMLPAIAKWCKANGHVYGEAAGKLRWTAGRELTEVLHRSTMTLEIPRHDLPTVTNPYQIPCTYTGPRLHIAAATQTFALVVGGKPDGVYSMYPRCEAGQVLEQLEKWLALSRMQLRQELAAEAFTEYSTEHAPARRVGQLLDALHAAGLIAAGALPAS